MSWATGTCKFGLWEYNVNCNPPHCASNCHSSTSICWTHQLVDLQAHRPTGIWTCSPAECLLTKSNCKPPSLHVLQNTAALAIRHKASHKQIEEKLSSYSSIGLWVYEFMGPTRLIDLLCVQLPKLQYSVEHGVRVVGFGQQTFCWAAGPYVCGSVGLQVH